LSRTRRGYIIQSHLSWRERSSASLPTVAEPFGDFGGVDVVVVDPSFVAGVVGRVDIDAFDASGVFRQQGLEGVEVVALDDEVAGGGVALGELGVGFEQADGHLLVVADDGVFSDPVESGHEGAGGAGGAGGEALAEIPGEGGGRLKAFSRQRTSTHFSPDFWGQARMALV